MLVLFFNAQIPKQVFSEHGGDELLLEFSVGLFRLGFVPYSSLSFAFSVGCLGNSNIAYRLQRFIDVVVVK